jgi:rRNA-processing protein Efg1
VSGYINIHPFPCIKPTNMVKADSSSSSHILQRKFKPWRRGKSTKGKHTGKTNHTSLKQQLRGVLRLRKKNQGVLSAEMEERLHDIQQQIQQRELSEKERRNATKSHKVRFLDRQKTMRRYKQLVSSLSKKNSSKEGVDDDDAEVELYKLALDQIYIAHYPLGDTSYLSLYNNNNNNKHRDDGDASGDKDHHKQQGLVMNARSLFKRATTRHRALEKSRNTDERVSSSWVPVEQYERLARTAPEKWTTELERTTFGIQISSSSDHKQTLKKKQQQAAEEAAKMDKRFQVSNQHTQLVDEAEQIEKDLEEAAVEGEFNNDDDDESIDNSDDASDDDDDDSNGTGSVMAETKNSKDDDVSAPNKAAENDDEAHAVGRSSDDSDDSSSSDSGDSSEESSDDDDDEDQTRDQTATTLLVADGFLTAIPTPNVFDNHNAAQRLPMDRNGGKGDKSKGWATQRQLPGEFRKRRKR